MVTNCIPKDPLDSTNFANSMSPNRDIQSSTNGLTIPHSPKSVVPDICVNTGHKFSNLLPMLGYCEQCSVRVFVGMFYMILKNLLFINCMFFIIIFAGVKCKICKFRYHKGCLSKVPLHCSKSALTDDNDSALDGKLFLYKQILFI